MPPSPSPPTSVPPFHETISLERTSPSEGLDFVEDSLISLPETSPPSSSSTSSPSSASSQHSDYSNPPRWSTTTLFVSVWGPAGHVPESQEDDYNPALKYRLVPDTTASKLVLGLNSGPARILSLTQPKPQPLTCPSLLLDPKPCPGPTAM